MREKINPKNTFPFRRVLLLLELLFLVLFFNGFILAGIDLLDGFLEQPMQGISYQYSFSLHLVAGAFFAFVMFLYLVRHLFFARYRRNMQAKKKGLITVLIICVVIVSGVLLTRGIPFVEITNSLYRIFVYFMHICIGVVIIGAFHMHKMSSRRRVYYTNYKFLTVIALAIVAISIFIPGVVGGKDVDKIHSFSPSLAKIKHSGKVESKELVRDDYCLDCHKDTHERWEHSAHKLSSFNNPFYRQSVMDLRKKLVHRDGDVDESRFCAGCHDPVPLFTGEFDNPSFDLKSSDTASAGITCTVCHSITSVDSTKGNSDYTVTLPTHYPFAFSDSKIQRWFNHLLIKSNPDFHKRTFLKPLHGDPEFCSSCHKVHIPKSLNNYRWLRGQNHFDSFYLSGVSGHNIDSFYYPDKAKQGCNGCHMKGIVSDDFGSSSIEFGGDPYIKDHLFASGNTAINAVSNDNKFLNEHKEFLNESVLVDIIGFREEGRIGGKFIGPLKQGDNVIKPGSEYLLDVVLKTKKLGHAFTNGTTDSNQVWVSINVADENGVILQSGAIDEDGVISPKDTHFVKAYLIDKSGEPINRRNVEDIYTSVYNHQIPPGASDVLHYRIRIPEEIQGKITIKAELRYRKFSQYYVGLSLPDLKGTNPLPIVVIDSDEVNFDSSGVELISEALSEESLIRRLNDYGIGLLRKPRKSHFKVAEAIFKEVQLLGNEQGALNLIRLYFSEGRIEEVTALLNAMPKVGVSNAWSVEYYRALVEAGNGNLGSAILRINSIFSTQDPLILERGFDFSKDYRLLATLANWYFQSSNYMEPNSMEYNSTLNRSVEIYKSVLLQDSENVNAHYGLAQIYKVQGDEEKSRTHIRFHEKYKKDEYAEAVAVSIARKRDPNLDKLARGIVIYELDKISR